MSLKRIMNEVKEIRDYIESEPSDNHRFIDIITSDTDMYNMEVYFLGPKETPYEEIVNNISIQIPKEYPHKAPKMRFINRIFHPNISTDGTICLDILKDNWRPIYTLRITLISIISLLSDPNPASPLNGEAAILYEKSLKTKEARRYYNKMILLFSENNVTKKIY